MPGLRLTTIWAMNAQTIKNTNLGSRETYPPGNQVPARPGHWAVSFPEGPGPSCGQGKGGKGARPHKISGLEPENSPKGDCVQRHLVARRPTLQATKCQ